MPDPHTTHSTSHSQTGHGHATDIDPDDKRGPQPPHDPTAAEPTPRRVPTSKEIKAKEDVVKEGVPVAEKPKIAELILRPLIDGHTLNLAIKIAGDNGEVIDQVLTTSTTSNPLRVELAHLQEAVVRAKVTDVGVYNTDQASATSIPLEDFPIPEPTTTPPPTTTPEPTTTPPPEARRTPDDASSGIQGARDTHDLPDRSTKDQKPGHTTGGTHRR